MFKRILIANRGEPAVRIVRTCRELGVESVVVFSEVDRDTLGVRLADHAVCIGPAPVADSYENIPRILSAAEISDCEAIHPGYGFLAESAEFAEAVEACKLQFVGPSSATIQKTNDRLSMRRMARELKIPVLPGSYEELGLDTGVKALAEEVGYPLMLQPAVKSEKFWIVRRERDLESTLRLAQAEAKGLLNDARVFMVSYVESARYLDLPFLADRQGRIALLPEWDSTVRHHQKRILVESPSPALDQQRRQELCHWAIRLVQGLEFRGVGSVEFLLDPGGRAYFLGIRVCLGSEHPLSEVLTDIDLVAAQLKIAHGLPLEPYFACDQNHWPSTSGVKQHAVLCQVSAEDAEHEFMPTAGTVTGFSMPGGPGVRVDTHTFAGYKGSAHYDTLVAKITVWAGSREASLARMDRTLRETVVDGVKTTLEFQQRVVRLEAVRQGTATAELVEQGLPVAPR